VAIFPYRPRAASKRASRTEQDARTTVKGKDKKRNREVVDAAAKVFHERGYVHASVQDVADELGILKGSVYYYIRTKEDLLFWLLEEVHDEVEQILEEVLAIDGLEPLDRLALYIRRQVEHNASNLMKISIYYHDAEHLGEERRKDIAARRKVHERFVEEMISAAQARGEVSAQADARLLANFIFANIIWPYRWYRPGGRTSREELAEACVTYALSGLQGEYASRGDPAVSAVPRTAGAKPARAAAAKQGRRAGARSKKPAAIEDPPAIRRR
jgi:TetR/AcrR family transcriptional regulator, cholesterol catabolism regulator